MLKQAKKRERERKYKERWRQNILYKEKVCKR